VQALVIRNMGVTGAEKQKAATMINEHMKDCGATLAVMISDVWVAEVPKGGTLPASVRNHAGRTEALVVTMWGPKQPTTMGVQSYSRDAKGKPVFGDLLWQEPQKRSASLFAGQDLDAVFEGDSSAVDDVVSPDTSAQ
jgi:hypothetical protein